jgi:hypothetical protein
MANLVRVLQNLDMTLIVLHPAMHDQNRPPDIPDDKWAVICFNKMLVKHPEWQGLVSVDIMSDALPKDRAKRHKWRLINRQVIVLDDIPDHVDPIKPIFEAIAAANTLPELKDAIKGAVEQFSGGRKEPRASGIRVRIGKPIPKPR